MLLKSTIISENFKKDKYSSTFIFESNSKINDIILPEPISYHYSSFALSHVSVSLKSRVSPAQSL